MISIEEAIQTAIGEKIFPGAALLVASKGEVVFRSFFGNATLFPHPEPVTEKTLFDIASLTKPVATAMIALAAMRDKGLSLHGSAAKYLKEMEEEEDKRKITIRHLLKHTAGLPAWRPYFKEIAREHPEIVGKRESRQYYLEKISQESLEMPVAYQRIYSDLGFILVGILLENFLETTIDQVFAEKVAGPLELADTFYIPVGARAPRPYESFAATEDSGWRKKLIRGEVHDDNAYTLGGVAGHAGLFSTIDDLHRFLIAFEKGYRGESPILPQELIMEFVGPKVKFKLGWDTPAQDESQAGKHFSRNSIGHLGDTGCSFWVDLEKDFHVILLTNRVHPHPTPQNDAIKQFRPKFHDLIYEELIAPKR